MRMRRCVQKILAPQRFAAFALPLLAVAGAASAAPVSDLQRQDYMEYCASCHGPMGRGDGPVAAELKKRPADLTQLAKNNNGQFPYTRVRAIIDGRGQALGIHGPAEMPVWGQRFRDEGNNDPQVRAKILSIVDYLASIQEK
ncbi:c-type cytochrome [Immundisolibacter sp.]|uniref:c-type cytochrome n=1 Tax=Immundisolibacter sp. TaxID=1934948 RepID=UPI00263571E2|nr:c-type cytochrome [Immundisolibacter sp.]MDD3652368.1 c-type cytochrome [Immundisolibacter sp.]